MAKRNPGAGNERDDEVPSGDVGPDRTDETVFDRDDVDEREERDDAFDPSSRGDEGGEVM